MIDQTEVVDQDSYPQAVLSVEDLVEQRRLAGAEETRQKRNRDGIAPRDGNGFGSGRWGEYRIRRLGHGDPPDTRSQAGGAFVALGPIYLSSTLIPRASSILRGFRTMPGHF